MNNEMDDFSGAPGVPNQFNLIGGIANEIVPEKRPLKPMTPTLIFDNGNINGSWITWWFKNYYYSFTNDRKCN